MPLSAEIALSKQRIGNQAYEQCNCYPEAGYQATYIHFGSNILGDGFAVSRFIEPHYRIGRKVGFMVKGSIGAIYLSKPYDAVKNPANNSYSLHFNPYFNLGSGFSYAVGKHVSLTAAGFFHHTSNSGFKHPNRGINWFTAGLGLQYSASNELPVLHRSHNRYWKHQPIDIEAGIFVMPHQGYNDRLGIERNYILGTFVQGIKQVGRISGLVAGAEIYYSKFLRTPQPVNNSMVIGIQGGHVFLLGKATLAEQVGIDVFNKTAIKTNYYTRWVFNYAVSKRVKVGASLKAQSDYADFADLRLGYSFGH